MSTTPNQIRHTKPDPESELVVVNDRRLKRWGSRINETGSLAQCLIAMRDGTDELHICIEPGTKIEDVDKLLRLALAEVQEKLKGGAS